MRTALPKFDLMLAAATTAPAATNQVAAAVDESGAIRFFTVPITEFTWNQAPVFVTAPDILALASSFVLVARFATWGIGAILTRMRNRRSQT